MKLNDPSEQIFLSFPPASFLWAIPLHSFVKDNLVEYEINKDWIRASISFKNLDFEITKVEESGETRVYFSVLAHKQHYAGIVERATGVEALVQFLQTGILNDQDLDVGNLKAL